MKEEEIKNKEEKAPEETPEVAPEMAEKENTEAGDKADSPEAKSAPEEAKKVPDWKEQYARVMADFDNFRKRTARDREDLFKSAAADILKDLLPTVDNLALALSKAENKDDPFVEGVKMVYDGFLKVLADHGATPLDAVGEPFDANFHEALTTQPSPDVPEGNVMLEMKRGWLLNGKLLRAAQVVVSAGKVEA